MNKLAILCLLVVLTVSLEEVESTTYDEDYAKQLFYLTSASYCSEKKITNWDCGTPCK